MPIIQQVKVDNEAIPGFYQKIPTEGDLHRFASAETGKAQFVSMSDSSGRIVTGSGYLDITLDFRYLMGVKQLKVAFVNANTGLAQIIPNAQDVSEARNKAGSNFPTSFDLSNASFVYYEEFATDVVRVYHVSASDILLFYVPHTATPAAISNRQIIDNQGDNIAIELLGDGDGLLLRAPNGRRALIRLTDNLNINVQPK
jgi:hypothetical protein